MLIGLHVDKRGYLSNVRLENSSGYFMLDSAAISAINKVKNIPVNLWAEEFNPIELELPVIYRLSSG